MNKKRVKSQTRVCDAIDRDLMDAKITLDLIGRLTEQNSHPQTCPFSNEELQTLIRNCTHATVLHLTKAVEKPRVNLKVSAKTETYNLEFLIDSVCHDEDKDTLKKECYKIRGNKVYSELIKYRHNIIAHRNLEYRNYQAMEREFAECRDYLVKKKGQIKNLIEKINCLQINIKISQYKKLGFPDDGSSISLVIVSK